MKVLHINQSDISGGAAIAGYRLHEGLLAQDIDSRLLVGKAQSSSNHVISLSHNKVIEEPLGRITRYFGLNYLNHISSFNIIKHSFYERADILNFHNLHNNYFNYLAIAKLTQNKPAVFTLHDMWSFTGHCSYSFECDRWKFGCGNCPDLDIYPNIKKDNTSLEWKLKNWVYSNSKLTIITLSNWLTRQVKQSILSRFSIHHIPNGIDTQVYQPLDPKACRSVLGIGKDKKVLMFAADKLKDSRKGGDLLLKALKSLPNSLKDETILLTFGEGGQSISNTVGIETLNMGYVRNDRLKVIAYSAADLVVFPTRADNLPLVLQESMACGTPMISFNIGGVPDLVRPGITGHLAKPEDANDFCNQIVSLLEDVNLRDRMSQNCRAITLKEYSIDLQAKRYIDLYKQVMTN